MGHKLVSQLALRRVSWEYPAVKDGQRGLLILLYSVTAPS